MSTPATIAILTAFAESDAVLDVVCTRCAVAVGERFGGRIYGYFCEDNPTAIVGKSVGGHDFIVVRDRFLVDVWASQIEGINLKSVFDLQDADDAAFVAEFYGPRERWNENTVDDVAKVIAAADGGAIEPPASRRVKALAAKLAGGAA